MQIQTVSTTVSKVNQTAVPSIVRRVLDVSAGSKLLWSLNENNTVTLKPAPKKWGSYMRGVGKGTWSGLDIDKYVRGLRVDRKVA